MKYKNPKTRIETADFKDFLPTIETGESSLVLTDLPRFSDETSPADAPELGIREWDIAEIDHDTLTEEAYRILKPNGVAVIWCDSYIFSDLKKSMKKSGFQQLRTIAWRWAEHPYEKKFYLLDNPAIGVVGGKGRRPQYFGYPHKTIYEYLPPTVGEPRFGEKEMVHPFQKPFRLFMDIVYAHTELADSALIVDPFLGSGVTARAAYQGLKRFAGCDIDPKYASEADDLMDQIFTEDKELFDKMSKYWEEVDMERVSAWYQRG